MKVFFISYSQENNSEIINDRIKSLGDYYCLKNTEYLVCSTLERADDVYSSIAKSDFTKLNILIISVNTQMALDYWGVSKKELWTWLSNHNNV